MDDFNQFNLPRPSFDQLAAQYKAVIEKLDAELQADSPETKQVVVLIKQWDQLRSEYLTWSCLVEVRFCQDTTNEEYKANQEYQDELSPKVTDFDVQIQKLLVSSSIRPQLEEVYGTQAFALWEKQVASFAPVIEEDTVQESKLSNRYNELLASAEFDFKGEKLNLSGIVKYEEDSDRDARYQAAKLIWGWFDDKRPELDEIYDTMVKLRQSMAEKLGYKNFIELGYQRMNRIDYNQEDVANYREEIRKHVVPLCQEIHQHQAQTLELDKLMFWDEGMFHPSGNPRPQGTYEEQIQAAQEMFDDMGPSLGSFFQLMRDKNLMDLQNRPGKAGGGFCTDLATEKVPFIFANFNGTQADVNVFTHEMGHAYQCYSSSHQPLYDYLWPTYESCEIHSMSMEYLTWPSMDKFFGDATDQFCRLHLMSGLLFLPYGVAIDHFQHLVYEKPEATPAQRHAMWQEVEKLYLPDTDYGDLPHLGQGGRWQQKRHVYMSPFYYIDYTLAQCCAFQFWVRSRTNPQQAMADYLELCQRGGTLPFQQLTQSAGLKSPFEPGSLAEVVQHAREFLQI